MATAGLALLLAAASALPIVLLVALAHGRSLARAEDDLGRVAEVAGRLLDRVVTDADADLARFARIGSAVPSAEMRRLLRDVVTHNPFVRELAVVDAAGALRYTTADHGSDPSAAVVVADAPPLEVLGLFRTEPQRGRALVVSRPLAEGGRIDGVLDQRPLTAAFEELELGPDGWVAFATADGRVLAAASRGPAPTRLAEVDPTRRLRVLRHAGNGDLLVAVEVDRQWILRDWQASAAIASPVAVVAAVLSAGLAVVLRRRPRGLDHDLRLGLQRGELTVEYQPIVDLDSGGCRGAEALVRWQHPRQGRVPPGVFVPLAEASGLMQPLTEWVMARVVADLQVLCGVGLDLYVAINCSPSSFLRGSLDGVIERVGVDDEAARRLVLEVTEHVFVDDRGRVVADAMGRLRQRGFRFALDDFGTGYSALASLRELRFEYLKIDRAFVQAIDHGEQGVLLVDTLVDLARRFGAEPVAEGVETEGQRQYLLARRVRDAQGWLFAPSLPLDDLVGFARRVGTAPACGAPR